MWVISRLLYFKSIKRYLSASVSGHGYQKKAKPEDNEEDGFNECKHQSPFSFEDIAQLIVNVIVIVASCGKGIKDDVSRKQQY
jgi:hypothetical protein